MGQDQRGTGSSEPYGGGVSGLQIIMALSVMFVMASVQGSVGFGQNLLAAPLLLQIDESLVPGSIVVAAATTNLMLFLRERGEVDYELAVPAIIGRVPGAIVGAIVVASASTNTLSLIVACSVFGVVALSALGGAPKKNRALLGSAGLLSGFTGTTSSIGGPFVALAMSGAPGPTLRSSMGIYFASGSVMTISLLIWSGVIDREVAINGLIMIPAALLGFYSSRWFVPILDRGYTRPAIMTLSTIAAILLLVRFWLV